jgi:hypothetical protein
VLPADEMLQGSEGSLVVLGAALGNPACPQPKPFYDLDGCLYLTRERRRQQRQEEEQRRHEEERQRADRQAAVELAKPRAQARLEAEVAGLRHQVAELKKGAAA